MSSSNSSQTTIAPRSDFLVWKYGNSVATPSDELDLGIDRETDPLLDVHTWWVHHQTQYPGLFRIAMDVMSIPCMSAEVGRVFSRYLLSLTALTLRAKLMVMDRRNRLAPEIVEASECFNAWSRANLLPGTPAVEISQVVVDSGEESETKQDE
jgi:hypothetical protein